jgi:DNA-binding PadR family transcriptional regulator
VKSERRVRDNLAKLVERGLIVRERRESKGGRGRRPDLIRLLIDGQPDVPSGADQPDVSDGPTGRSSHDQPDVASGASIQGNRQEEPSGNRVARPEVERLCQLMADLSNARTDPEGTRPEPKYKVTKGGRDEMRRLIDIDGRSPELIERAIRWVDKHDFWRKNILAPEKLRVQFDRIFLEAQEQRGGAKAGKADRVQSTVETLRQGAKS